MEDVALRIPFDRAKVESLSARFQAPGPGGPGDTGDDGDAPGERESAILLACGAGSSLDSPFMEAVAAGLVARGFPVLRFHYPYRDRALAAGKRMGRPDPPAELEAAHLAALAELGRRRPGRRAILAGKSLGGRIGTRVAAKGAGCAALVLFGYPLHPAKKPERLRTEHFPAIAQPALFLQGTRDDLCDLALLRTALETFGGPTRLRVIEGANHGFAVLKSSGRTDADVLAELLDEVDAWEASGFPGDRLG